MSTRTRARSGTHDGKPRAGPAGALREISVRNLALLESETVGFGGGLNVVTGVTGAGKSLLLGALDLLLGGRFSREMVRSGAAFLEVAGIFDLSGESLVARVEEVLGDGAGRTAPFELVVARRVDAAGRNRCTVDGTVVAVSVLRQLGASLVEIHGQSEHQALLDPAVQCHLLDRTAGLDAVREEYVAALTRWRDVCERLRRVSADARDRMLRAEALESVLREIHEAQLRPGEQEELRAERRLLADAERHTGAVASALAAIEGSRQEEVGAADRIGRAARELDDTAELSSTAREAQEALDDALARLSDAARSLQACAEDLRPDPGRLEEVQDRLELLGNVLRRHGPTEEDALRVADEAQQELTDLLGEQEGSGALSKRAAELAAQVESKGRDLNARRRVAADRFASAVADALAQLGMAGTRFAVAVDDGEGDLSARAGPDGLGTLEFRFSANAGEEVRALSKIASGGELARVALAVKGELAAADEVPLLVFDEVDADVGPRLGEEIGRRLRELAKGRQVLVVTHLPQVAAFADLHLCVRKETVAGRTQTRVTQLAGPEREHEIAEMLLGAERAADALGQARALLADAGRG